MAITGNFGPEESYFKLPEPIKEKKREPRQSIKNFDNLTPEKVKESKNKMTELPLPAIPRRNGSCISG